MSIEKVNAVMRESIVYSAQDVATMTGITSQSANECLLSLYRGGIVDREKRGNNYYYRTKQRELNF